MLSLKPISPPAYAPVTLTEAKLHLRIDHAEEDTLIEQFIDAATGHVDGPRGFLGRALIDQTWDLYLDRFPTREIKIPLPPLIELISVTYDDTGGVATILDPSLYSIDDVSEPGWIVPVNSSWPSTFDGINAVRIRFRAGYVDNSFSPAIGEVPADIRSAILLYVGSLYANRETIIVGVSAMEIPWSAEQLLLRRRIDVSLA
jgi:uncharacterized phiE125 gp8 family phage protein